MKKRPLAISSAFSCFQEALSSITLARPVLELDRGIEVVRLSAVGKADELPAGWNARYWLTAS